MTSKQLSPTFGQSTIRQGYTAKKEAVKQKKKKDEAVPELGWVWVFLMACVVIFVFATVNFGFLTSLIKAELISHAAVGQGTDNVATCRLCGTKSLAYCVKCGSPMIWDEPLKHFVCPSCKNVGLPLCPQCGAEMFGVAPGTTTPNTVTGEPIPAI